ncbi:MAG: c-type cytochrome domain-containing protein [Candidatus Eisenbacteria bacterium]
MPRIEARSANERATLGYLYGNCSMCHNDTGPLAELAMSFDVPTVPNGVSDLPRCGRPSGSTIGGTSGSLRVSPGDAGASWLFARVSSRSPGLQMPPLGTSEPDSEAIARLARWIREDLVAPPAPCPPKSNSGHTEEHAAVYSAGP